MKYTLLIVAFNLFTFSSMVGQPPDIMDLTTSAESDRTLEGNCIRLHLDLGKRLIVRDCPDYDYYSLDPDREFSIETSSTCIGQGCRLEVQVSFNGTLLYKETIYEDTELHLPIDYQVLTDILGKQYTADEAMLEIRYTKSCWMDSGIGKPFLVKYDPIVKNIPIQIRSEYDTYQVDVVTDWAAFNLCTELYHDNQEDIFHASSCCGVENYLDFNIRNIEGKKLKVSGGISIGQKFGSNSTNFNLGIDFTLDNYLVSEVIHSMGISHHYAADDGECIYPGLKLYFKEHEIRKYVVVCDGDDVLVETLDNFREIIRTELTYCKYSFDCNEENDPDPRFDILPINDFGYRNCSATIHAVLTNAEPGMHYEYEWSGPDGQQYFTNLIDEVPYGKYELTIYDGCCNAFHYTVNVCDEYEYGPWYYENSKYCREVICGCDQIYGLRSQEEYIMCVDPHRYNEDWIFNETTLLCNKHAYWTDQDGFEIDLTQAVGEADIQSGDSRVVKAPSEVIEYYDENTNQCIREYYCGEQSLGFMDQSQPTYGAWGYDEFLESCYREILCFGEKAKDENGYYLPEDAIEAEFGTWEYDNFDDRCYRKIFCSGSNPVDEWNDEIQDETEDIEISWTVENDWDLECIGVIYCDGEETDVEIAVAPEVDWDLDSYGQCVTNELTCNGEDQQTIEEEPNDLDEWQYDAFSEICFREVHCETADEWFEHFVVTNFWPDYTDQAGCNEEAGEYSYQVICDGENSDIFICRDESYDAFYEQLYVYGFSSINNNPGIDLARGTHRTEIIPDHYYTIKLYSVEGKPLKTLRLSQLDYLEQFLSMLTKTSSYANQLLFYSVYNNSELLYSGKFAVIR